MKRWAALVAATLIASVSVVVTPAAAQVAPADPTRALRRQFHPERGVHIAEVTRYVFDDKDSMRVRANGRVQFARSGPVASDATWRVVVDPSLRKWLEEDELRAVAEEPAHWIVVGGYRYVSDGFRATPLPEGKTWVRSRHFALDADITTEQVINVFDPAVLKTILKG
nr:hypothetical protein GCM10020093_056690 [Planobispora longispora]